MGPDSADRIGQDLARMARAGRSQQEPTSSREQIRRLLHQVDGPLSLEELSELTGLHANTLRTHLEMLRAAGDVQRVRGATDGRGRPRWLYAAVTDSAYHRLAHDLVEALEQADDPRMAAQAAERWREAEHLSHRSVGTPDEAVEAAAGALEQMGFEVATSPAGDALYLGNCPYAALANDHRAICEIHARALEQVLAGTGQDVELDALDVFPRPGVCVAHLRRPDLQPHYVVPGSRSDS